MTSSSTLAWLLPVAAMVGACATGSDTTSPEVGGATATGAAGATAGGGQGGATGGHGGATGGYGGQGGTTAGGGGSGGSGGGGSLCGNGEVDPGETCDGVNFGGKTCVDYGLGIGWLNCNAYCQVVLSGCTPLEVCNNGIDDDQDMLTDCMDVDDCAQAPNCLDSCAQPLQLASLPDWETGDTSGAADTETASCSNGGGGSELFYAITATSDADWLIALYSDADFSLSVRTTCDDAGTELACLNKVTYYDSEELNLHVTQGTTYYVMLEGVSPSEYGYYDLSVDEVLPETDCGDFADDDSDGYLDCDDATSCKGTLDCTPGAGAPGVPCLTQNDCASSDGDPLCLPDWAGWIGGYCSEFCDLAAPDCTGDSVCVDLGISVDGVCLDGCVTVAECRPGYACVDVGASTKVCTKTPELNCWDHADNDGDGFVDCEDATSCQGQPACSPGPNAVGEPCQIQNECQSADGDPYCIDETLDYWPGGYCSEFCNASDPCPPGSVCAYDVIYFPSGNGLCLVPCSGPNDCRPSYDCMSSSAGMVCQYW